MSFPQTNRPCTVLITRAESLRFDRLVQRVGKKNAAVLLGTSASLLEACIDQGRMMQKTRDRLVAALETIERVA